MGGIEESGLTEAESRRFEKIRSHSIPEAAIKRFLISRDVPVPDSSKDFSKRVAKEIDDGLLQELLREYKYAGQQTLNYFVMTGLSDYDFSDVLKTTSDEFPTRDDVEGVPNTPYFADSETWDERLYLTFGFFIGTGGVDPVTGRSKSELTTKRCVVVIREDSDLVEIRTSEPNIVEKEMEGIGEGLGGFNESTLYRPDFDAEFQEEFEDLVEKYTNLKVRVEDREGTTVDTISFTSRESEAGVREDARRDERVSRELEERGGEITIGYVHLNEGFRFQINRKQAKITIKKSEREENIEEITQIIDDVLKNTGGYPQSTLGGLGDVPE